MQWRYGQSPKGNDQDRPDPFAEVKEGEDPQERDKHDLAFSDFQLVRGRVFCVRGGRELISLDGDTGALDWSFSSPPGQINPNFWIGSDRTVLQVDKPNQLLVLRTDDGQPVSRTPLAESERLERPPMPADEDSVLLVSDRRTVKKFDFNHGQTVWVYQETPDLPVNGPPRLIGDSDRLLVLHDGRLLIRLDPATGSKRWSCMLGIEDLSERPTAMAYDDKRFYCVNLENILGGLRQVVRAVRCDDGSRVWSSHLSGPGDATWSLALTQRYVIAYPRNKTNASLEIESMPVIVRLRETGTLVQRFVFPTTIADAIVKADSAAPWWRRRVASGD